MARLERPKEAMIRVRTGFNGIDPVKSLMALHDKTRQFKIDVNWVDAFQLEFGVTVDPEQFLIMRAQSGRSVRPLRLSLLENISVLLDEFKTIKRVYNVFVVRNMRNRIRQKTVQGTTVRQGRIIAPMPRPTPTPRKVSVVEVARKFLKASDKGPPDVGFSRSKRDSTNFNSIASRNAMIGNFENPGTSKRKKWTRSVRVTPPTATTTASSSEAVLDDYLKEYNESCGVVDDSCKVEADDGNDEDDARSETSQDSQLVDLHDLGIANQDVRTGFVESAKKNYTNSQFLMSRNELRILKRKKANRWAKWTLAAPTATNIIRDLLGV